MLPSVPGSSSVWTLPLLRGHSAQGWTLSASPPPPSAGPSPAGTKSALVMKTRVSGRRRPGRRLLIVKDPETRLEMLYTGAWSHRVGV